MLEDVVLKSNTEIQEYTTQTKIQLDNICEFSTFLIVRVIAYNYSFGLSELLNSKIH